MMLLVSLNFAKNFIVKNISQGLINNVGHMILLIICCI